MGLHGAVTALKAVCPQSGAGGKLEFGENEVDEEERDLVEDLPAVLGGPAVVIKQRHGILRLQPNIEGLAAAQTQVKTAFGIPLEVKVAVAVGVGAEEKFQAAVEADHGHRAFFFSTDVLLYGSLVDIDGGIIVADLLAHTDVGIRQPQNVVHLQGRDAGPVRLAGHPFDHVFSHGGNLLIVYCHYIRRLARCQPEGLLTIVI